MIIVIIRCQIKLLKCYLAWKTHEHLVKYSGIHFVLLLASAIISC